MRARYLVLLGIVSACFSDGAPTSDRPGIPGPYPSAFVVSSTPGGSIDTMQIYQKWIDYRGWSLSPGEDTVFCPAFLISGPGWNLGDSALSPVSTVGVYICSPAFKTLPDSFDATFDPNFPGQVWTSSQAWMSWGDQSLDADSGRVSLRRLENGMVDLKFGFRYHQNGDTTQATLLRLHGEMVVSDTAGP